MHREFIQKLTNLVEANLVNETFGPEDLAREAGMSHTNLNRKLKTISNQNTSHFIREVRLKKAKELLLNTDLTVAEISYRVGFGSSTYFNKCFHDLFGVAPGELRNHEQENEPEGQPVELLPKKRNRTKNLIVLLVGLIILIPLSVVLINKVSKTAIKEKSIAVLPFKYLSDEAEKQYLADGMMDAILTGLSKIKDLRVISRTSVEQYRNTEKTTGTIGKELDVAYLLEGSFLKNGNQVRLVLQLIRTSDDSHVWTHGYNGDWNTIFGIQSEVTESVASALNTEITPEEKQLIQKMPTINPNAYDFYIRGVDEFDNYDDSISLENAQHLFQKAVELDSTFALGYSLLAGVYWSKHYWKTFLSETFLDSVLILSNLALAYDDQCAKAYYYKGLRYYNIGKPSECLKEFDKAIKFDPNEWKTYYRRGLILQEGFNDFVGTISNLHEAILRNRGKRMPDLLSDLGVAYMDIGFPEVGKQYWQKALELDEDSARYLYWFIPAEYFKGNFENAYQLAKSLNKRDSVRAKIVMPSICIMTGRGKEAYYYFEHIAERLKKSGEIDLVASQAIGYSYWKAGKTNEAEYYFNQQIKISLECIRLGRWNTINRLAHFNLAKVYAFKGDKEKAYRYLDEVNKNQSFDLWWVTEFKYSPFLNSIRQEPRFQKILKNVEAKYQAEHERVRKWLVSQGML